MIQLLLMVSLAGCKTDAPASAGSTTPSTTGTGGTTGTSGTPPGTSTSPPGPCEAPDAVADDPLWTSGRLDVVDAGASNLVHITDVVADFDEGIAWAVGYGGLMSFDISDPSSPAFLGTSPSAEELHKLTRLDADRVLVTNRESGMRLYDVTNRASPVSVGSMNLPGAGGMATTGDGIVYLLNHEGALSTYDFSDPEKPIRLGTTEGLGSPWVMQVEGDRGYIADNTMGIVVVDLTDPRAPVLLGSIEAAGGVQDISIDGGHLYAAVGSAGIEVFDLAAPDTPASVATLAYGAAVVSVSASEGVVFATNHESVIAVDASDPAQPVSIGVQNTEEWAMHVDSRGTSAFVGDWSNVEMVETDPGIRSPAAELSRSEIYLYSGSETIELSLSNLGAGALEVYGMGVDDARFAAQIDSTSIAPGAAGTITLVYTADGGDVETSLCVVTNDPEQSTRTVTLATSSDSSTGIAIGEPAIDFVLPDLDGEYHQLSEQFGAPVVLVYFATW